MSSGGLELLTIKIKEMEKVKCITFDKEAQDNLPKEVKDKMKANQDKARKNKELEEYPCYNCQGGGCPVCGGYGTIKA